MTHTNYLSVLIEQNRGISADIQPLIPPVFASDQSPSDPSPTLESSLDGFDFSEEHDHHLNPLTPSVQRTSQEEQETNRTTFIDDQPHSLSSPHVSRTVPPLAPQDDTFHDPPPHPEGDPHPKTGGHEYRKNPYHPTVSPAHSSEMPAPPAPSPETPGELVGDPFPARDPGGKALRSHNRPDRQATTIQSLANPEKLEEPSTSSLAREKKRETDTIPSLHNSIIQTSRMHNAEKNTLLSQEELPPAQQIGAETIPPAPSAHFSAPVQPAPQVNVTRQQAHTATHPAIPNKATGDLLEEITATAIQAKEARSLAPATFAASPVYDIQPVPITPYEEGGRDKVQIHNTRSRLATPKEEGDSKQDEMQKSEAQMEEQAPLIQVTIGRIEVRATPSTHPPTARRAPAVRPTLTLKDYLEQRRKGQA